MSAVYFGGSRSLAPSALVNQVVQSSLSSGQSIHVGCCVGADEQVIQAASCSPLFSQVRVFAAFAFTGAGACSLSAFQAVREFSALGGPVSWMAGGSSQIVPLAGRLFNRSLAAFAGCSTAVFFSPGAGSLSIAFQAFSSGIPVFAFGDLPAPVALQGGQWVESSFQGFACWQWQSAQLSLF